MFYVEHQVRSAGGHGVVDRKENETVRIPKFKTEKQEVDWLYAHRREIEAGMRKEKRTKTPTVAQIARGAKGQSHTRVSKGN
jgi:hypothetical protein